jgi:hypothetical protein
MIHVLMRVENTGEVLYSMMDEIKCFNLYAAVALAEIERSHGRLVG